jgi:hypothetical protein
MPTRHSAWRRANQIVLRRLDPCGLSTDRKTILASRSVREACGQARPRMRVTRSSSLRITFGSISSSRCQTTCRRIDHRSKLARRFHGRLTAARGDPAGGARRDRTDDLLLAKQALSQLSYGPISKRVALKAKRLKKWWAWEDLNFRPHAYQARALTN